jgi:hypothetical protein
MYIRQHSLYRLTASAVSVTKKLQDNTISSIRYSVVSVRTLVAHGLFNSWFTKIVTMFSHEPKVKAPGQPKVTSACRQNIPWCPKVKETMTDNKAWQDNNEQYKGFVAHRSNTYFCNSTTTTSQLINIQQRFATIAMSNPNRGPGRPVPQLGAINNNLQSQSRAPASGRPTQRPNRHEDRQTRQNSRTRPREVQAERRQHQQTTSRDNPSTFCQHDQRHSRQTPHTQPYQSDQRKRRYRNDHHSTTPPRKEERGNRDDTRAASKAMPKHPVQTAASNKQNDATFKHESSLGKRKRRFQEDDPEAGRDQSRKKHQDASLKAKSNQSPKKHKAAYLKAKSLEQPSSSVVIDTDSSTAQPSDVTATPVPESQRYPVDEKSTQLPSPPSSNATPERQPTTKKDHVATPTPEERTKTGPELQSSPSAVTTQGTKRRRNDTVHNVEQFKRQRQMGTVKPTRAEQVTHSKHPDPKKPDAVVSPPMPTPTQNSPSRTTLREKLARKALAQAVRPESSFAPVEPNHESELEFLEYLNDSVPVLFSLKIQHSSENTSLNNPPGMLVLDALTAIEKNSRLQSKGIWPSSIELTGRTPSKGITVKVVDDVDLYLHEKDGKLHVATDLGLVAIWQYLKLIGVPEDRPVRFMGRVPPWAKRALNSRYTRKVVQVFGQDKFVKKDTPLEAHQVVLSFESHVEEVENRKKEAGLDHADDMKILDAGPGDLPLPLGSTVIVYKVDHDDVWAYGRLSGTDKTGRFPISYTCPIDWSLDRFACTDNSLNCPLPQSTDPTEEEWDGPFSWIKEKGFAEGPTWKETVEMTAAEAKAAKEVRLRFRKAKVNENATSTSNALNSPEALTTTDKTPNHTLSPAASPQMSATNAAISADAETANADPLAVDMEKAAVTVEVEAMQSAHDLQEGKENPLVPATKEAEKGERSSDTANTSSPETLNEVASKAATESVEPKPEEPEEPVEPAPVEPAPIEPEPVEPAPIEPEPVEPDRTESEPKTNVEPYNPFTKPREDFWARNDDIEVDWSDSEL